MTEEQPLNMTRTEFLKRFCGVDKPCPKCKGLGRYNYSHGSTWRGGVGVCAFTWDVCDLCWGTGDAHRVGVDLRKQIDEFNQLVRSEALRFIESRLGASYGVAHDALIELATELSRMSRGRKPRPRYFYDSCADLSVALTEMVRAAMVQAAKARVQHDT